MNNVAGKWRKSRRSGANGACVQVRLNAGTEQIRDSKMGDDSPILDGLTALHHSIRNEMV